MATHRWCTVDVFTNRPLLGNPVAVVLDAAGLTSATMQQIAAWTNLSETTFVLPPTGTGADYRTRIFTPRSELPFAGHPTIGTAHAVLEAGVVRPEGALLRQECIAGILPIRIDGQGAHRQLFVRVPRPKVTSLDAARAETLERILGVSLADHASVVDVGPVWIVARVADEGALLRLTPDMPAMVALECAVGATGVTVFADGPGADRVFVRSFAPSAGIAEDPVCGSGNAAVAAHRLASRRVRPGDGWVAAQGRAVGRDGHVVVAIGPSGDIEIGGESVTVTHGSLIV